MRYQHASFALTRDIELKGVPMKVVFWYYPPFDATREDPGFEGEIEIDGVWIDEFEVTNLFGEKSLNDVEAELWKLVGEGEEP